MIFNYISIKLIKNNNMKSNNNIMNSKNIIKQHFNYYLRIKYLFLTIIFI